MKQRLPAFAAVLSTLWLLSAHAGAAVAVNNFVITETTISFGISGILPGTAPAESKMTLFFVNPDLSADPGFVLGDFHGAFSTSFTGSQALDGFFPAGTGNGGVGDYFVVNFQNDLAADEAISGIFTATWSGTAFDPSQVTSLNIYWGAGDLSTVNTGVLLASVPVAVPEVSSVSLLIAGAVAVLPIRRRRK